MIRVCLYGVDCLGFDYMGLSNKGLIVWGIVIEIARV